MAAEGRTASGVIAKTATAEQVADWLGTFKVKKFADLVSTFNKVDGSALYSLKESQLRDLCGPSRGAALYNLLHADEADTISLVQVRGFFDHLVPGWNTEEDITVNEVDVFNDGMTSLYTIPDAADGNKIDLLLSAAHRGLVGTPLTDWSSNDGDSATTAATRGEDRAAAVGRAASGGAGGNATCVAPLTRGKAAKRLREKSVFGSGGEGHRAGADRSQRQRGPSTTWFKFVQSVWSGKSKGSFDDDFSKLWTNVHGVLVTAPSGSGKTQLLYDIAARRRCVFLICNTKFNGGMKDLETAIADCKATIGDTNVFERMERLAKHVIAILVSRLAYIHWLEASIKNCKPFDLLVAQLYCSQRITRAVWALHIKLMDVPMGKLSDMRDTLYSEFEGQKPAIILDEANTLLDDAFRTAGFYSFREWCWDSYPADLKMLSATVTAFRVCVDALTAPSAPSGTFPSAFDGVRLAVSGTGLHLLAVRSMGSKAGVFRDSAVTPRGFASLDTSDRIKQYLDFLGLSVWHDFAEDAAARVGGRGRWIATVVCEALKHRQQTSPGVSSYMITRGIQVVKTRILHHGVRSLVEHAKNLLKSSSVDPVALRSYAIELLAHAVVMSRDRRPVPLTITVRAGEDGALSEEARVIRTLCSFFCVVEAAEGLNDDGTMPRGSTAQFQLRLAEPLAGEALARAVLVDPAHSLRFLTTFLERMKVAPIESPSSAGCVFEQLDALATHALGQAAETDKKDAKRKLQKICGVSRLHIGPTICQNMSLADYLSMPNDSRPTFARVENEAGPDLVGWGEVDGTKVLIFIQDKCYDCRVDFDPKDAVFSVLPQLFFMRHRTADHRAVPPHLAATRENVQRALHELKKQGWKFFSRVTASVWLGQETQKYRNACAAFTTDAPAPDQSWVPEMLGHSILDHSTSVDIKLEDLFHFGEIRSSMKSRGSKRAKLASVANAGGGAGAKFR